jgi:hypothetical protein
MGQTTFATPFYSRRENAVFGKYPAIWFGSAAAASGTEPWKSAPLGSLYIRVTATTAVLQMKQTATGSGDWIDIGGGGSVAAASPAPSATPKRKATK